MLTREVGRSATPGDANESRFRHQLADRERERASHEPGADHSDADHVPGSPTVCGRSRRFIVPARLVAVHDAERPDAREAQTSVMNRTAGPLLEQLDFVYMPSSDPAADAAYFTDVLGGRLVFAIDGMGTRVAMVELTAGPPDTLAGHLSGQRPDPRLPGWRSPQTR